MERIKTGVIGLGRMGQHHCRVISYQRDAQLAGLFDINPKRLDEFATKYEVSAYPDLETMLQQVDAVVIATPTPTHFDLAVRCLERGIHVLLEKPITENLERAEQLVEIAERSGCIVQIGHIERFNPTYQELKKVLENLSLIAIAFRRLSPYQASNTDVDVVLDLMVHDLDLCIDLMGRPPVSVSAQGAMPFSSSLDHVVAELFYPAGPLITLTASRVTEQKIRSVEVTTQEAFVEADFLNKNILIHRNSSSEYKDYNSNGVKYHQESIIARILVPNSEPLALETRHFLDCIANRRRPCVSASDGLNALRLALEIRQQASEGLPQREHV